MILQIYPVVVSVSLLPVAMVGPAGGAGPCCQPAPAAQQQPMQPQAAATITCPLSGEQIPACCCPVKDEAEEE